jgi:hypothetical protein
MSRETADVTIALAAMDGGVTNALAEVLPQAKLLSEKSTRSVDFSQNSKLKNAAGIRQLYTSFK